jgi:hypothetical protein
MRRRRSGHSRRLGTFRTRRTPLAKFRAAALVCRTCQN